MDWSECTASCMDFVTEYMRWKGHAGRMRAGRNVIIIEGRDDPSEPWFMFSSCIWLVLGLGVSVVDRSWAQAVYSHLESIMERSDCMEVNEVEYQVDKYFVIIYLVGM